MEFLIYTIGDFEWSETVFRSLAMAFDPGTGVFGQANVLFGLGLLLSFFAGALKGIMEKGTVSFSMVVKGYLLWILLFLPRVDVVLESKSLGYASFFTDIPVGLAIGGAISTQVPMAFIDVLEDVFTMPQSAGSNLDALRTLVSLEKNVNGNGVRTLGGTPNVDLIATLDNYISGCVFKDIRLSPAFQEAKYRNILSQINSWEQMKVSSTVWYIESQLDGANSLTTVLTCKEAYETLDAQFRSDSSEFAGAMFMLAEQDLTNYVLNGDVSQHVDEYLFQLGNASVGSMDVMVNNFLSYHFMKNAANLPASDSLRGKLVDAMEFQTKEQRLFNMAGDRNLWLEMAPATISFFEAFVWFCAPLMSFLVLFGDGGLKLALGYFRMLLLVGMYPLIMILVNLYLDWSIQRALEPTLISGEAFTIGGLSNFYSESRSYIATASYMTTFIPMLAYMMLKGGEYAAVSMANRIGASTHIDTSPIAPNIAAGMKNGSLKMGTNNWGVTDNGMVHTRSGSPDINAPTLSGMSGLSSSLGMATQHARQSATSAEASFGKTFNEFYNQGRTAGFDASSGSGSSTSLNENQMTMARLSSALSSDKSTSDSTAKTLIAKLMGVASVAAGGGFGGGNSEDVQNSSSTTNTEASSETNKTGENSSEHNSNQRQNTTRNSKSGKTGFNFRISGDGKVSVEGSGGITLNSEEREALSRGLSRMRDEQIQRGTTFSTSDMESQVDKLSDQNGWGVRGQEVYAAHQKWSESENRSRTISQALQETNGFNLSNKTDFSGAANRQEFADWVQRGYRSEQEFNQLSESERGAISDQRGRAIVENMQHTGLDRGRAAAVLFSTEMTDSYQGIAQSNNIDQMQERLQQLSSRFNEAGHLTNDNNLKLMGTNFSNLAGKMGAVEYKAPSELSSVVGKTNELFDGVKTKAKGEIDTTSHIVENGGTKVAMSYEANKDEVMTAPPLETANWHKLDGAEERAGNIDVTNIPAEMKPLYDKATEGLTQVAANTAAMIYSKTASDLSGLSEDKKQHLAPAMIEGAALLTQINPDFSKFNEATYGAGVTAQLADDKTLNSEGLISPQAKGEHNLAVRNIEQIRNEMNGDPQFKAEVDGLTSGAYTMDGLMNYKQFMEGGVSGFVNVPTSAFSEVLAVGSHLGTQFSPDQMNTLLKDSAINTRFHEVKNEMMQSGYPDASMSQVMNEVAHEYYNSSRDGDAGEMIERGNNSMNRSMESYQPRELEKLGPYDPNSNSAELPPTSNLYEPNQSTEINSTHQVPSSSVPTSEGGAIRTASSNVEPVSKPLLSSYPDHVTASANNGQTVDDEYKQSTGSELMGPAVSENNPMTLASAHTPTQDVISTSPYNGQTVDDDYKQSTESELLGPYSPAVTESNPMTLASAHTPTQDVISASPYNGQTVDDEYKQSTESELLGPYSPPVTESNPMTLASAYTPTLDVITAGVRNGPSSIDGTLDPFDLDHGTPNYIDGNASPLDPDSNVKLS